MPKQDLLDLLKQYNKDKRFYHSEDFRIAQLKQFLNSTAIAALNPKANISFDAYLDFMSKQYPNPRAHFSADYLLKRSIDAIVFHQFMRAEASEQKAVDAVAPIDQGAQQNQPEYSPPSKSLSENPLTRLVTSSSAQSILSLPSHELSVTLESKEADDALTSDHIVLFESDEYDAEQFDPSPAATKLTDIFEPRPTDFTMLSLLASMSLIPKVVTTAGENNPRHHASAVLRAPVGSQALFPATVIPSQLSVDNGITQADEDNSRVSSPSPAGNNSKVRMNFI